MTSAPSRELQVLYFAALRELAGLAEERVTLPSEVVTVRDLVLHLQRIHPGLTGRLLSVRVALDEAFANDSDGLAGVSVAALIPPVAGG